MAGEPTFSQEFQLVSNNSSKLTWLLGLYYFHDKAAITQLTFPFAAGIPVGPPDILAGRGNITSNLKYDSYAAFAQARYAITDRRGFMERVNPDIGLGVILPGEGRLIESISAALRSMAPDLTPQQQGVLFNIQIALAELALREDGTFLQQHLETGEAMLAEGEDLARNLSIAVTAVSASGSITARLDACVHALSLHEVGNEAIRAYLAKVVDWEIALYQQRQRIGVESRSTETESPFTQEAIARYLNARQPDLAPFTLSGLRTLAGGFSKTTVMFDAADRNGECQSLVLRAEQRLNLLPLPGAEVASEFHILRLAQKAGLHVAEPLWLEQDRQWFGNSFLVSRRAAGSNLGSRVDVHGAISETLLRDVVQQLARIHQTRVDPADDDVRQCHLADMAAYETRTQAVRAEIAIWRAGAAAFGLPPSPLLTRVLAWLEANVPDTPGRPVLLHNDFGLHNILVEDGRLSCVLDWEGALMGDPAEDLAWLIDGLAGQVDRQAIIALYEEASGEAISGERLRFFAVLSVLKFAVTCPNALSLFEHNPECGVGACQLGLYFAYHGTSKLNDLLAEAADSGRIA